MLGSIPPLDAAIHAWASGHGVATEDFIRIMSAMVLGGLVGLERELRGRQAGFRTYVLVCVSSALVMIVSTHMAMYPFAKPEGININVDPARIAYGVMTGIGFLGAGVIVHQKGAVHGLTTAAGLWSVAAVGLSIGFGMYTLSLLVTLLVVVILWILDHFEDALPRLRYRTVTLRTAWRPGCVAEIVGRFKSAGLRVVDAHFDREKDIAQADIHVRIAFVNRDQYYAFERQLEGDANYQLISTREV